MVLANHFIDFIFSVLEHFPVIRAILGSMLVFFLPGFTWSLVLLRQINVLERTVFSFILSITLVTLTLLLLNRLLGISISGLNAVIIISGITILPLLVDILNVLIRKHSHFPGG